MFCSNCGQPMNEGAAICTACGFAKGKGVHYCENCGTERNPGAAMCVKCGFALGQGEGGESTKTKTVAGILYILLGALGVGDFYLGYTAHGVIKLLVSIFTVGFGAVAMWIWSIIDAVKCFQGEKTDAKGNKLKE